MDQNQLTEIVDTSQAAPLFPLGTVVATPGALALELDFRPFLAMHQCGFWGDVPPEDWQENDLSAKKGFRIMWWQTAVSGLSPNMIAASQPFCWLKSIK